MTKRENKIYIKDLVRNKEVRLTPEEWVRQHLLNYLITELHYPKGLIKLESQVNFNGLEQRSDVVVYKTDGTVFLIAECKRPEVNITRDTLYQAIRYNTKLDAGHILITNGNEHHCFHVNKETGSIDVMESIPEYERNYSK